MGEVEQAVGPVVRDCLGCPRAVGGTVQVRVHLDRVVRKPDVALDRKPIVRAGELFA